MLCVGWQVQVQDELKDSDHREVQRACEHIALHVLVKRVI